MPAPRLSAAADRMRDQINDRWPHRDKRSDGWVADARHVAAGTSDHIPDPRSGIVRAIDVDADLDKTDKRASWKLADSIRIAAMNGDRRIKYVIHLGHIASARRNLKGKAWQWRKHTGDPHNHHIHVSFDARGDLDRRPFQLGEADNA